MSGLVACKYQDRLEGDGLSSIVTHRDVVVGGGVGVGGGVRVQISAPRRRLRLRLRCGGPTSVEPKFARFWVGFR
eukprot:2687266-Pyramimonas_sp.AAC.3